MPVALAPGAHPIRNQVGDSNPDRCNTDVLDAARKVFGDFLRKCHNHAENHDGSHSERDPDQPAEQQQPLYVPTGALDFLLERRQIHALFDRRQAFPADQDATMMLDPLPECKVSDECDDDDCEFRMMFSLSPVCTHRSRRRLRVFRILSTGQWRPRVFLAARRRFGAVPVCSAMRAGAASGSARRRVRRGTRGRHSARERA